MSGLENIIREIEKKAETEASSIIKEAEEYCESYLTQEKEKISAEVSDFEKKAEKERVLFESKAASGAEAMERNAVLKAKQDNIDLAISKAYERLSSLSDPEYFEMIISLLKKNVLAKDGEILFGKKDLSRISGDFEKRIEDIAKEKGGSLKLVKDAAPISDGFILRYGMIEENCTLKALFETNENSLKDIALKNLFI